DRVYTIDQTFGLIEFGDGVHGRVPPIGRDNIRATYRAGGGEAGNVAAGEIKTLRTTIPFVEKAKNPEAAGGGSDTELIEDTLERGPQMIKHRGRAITAEDFEWLAREASRAISRVKCLPTFDDEGKVTNGWVTVIIVPKSTDARPVPSPQLRQRVEKYLSERAANVVSFPRRVRVSAPVYVEVKLTVDIFPVTMDVAPVVESEAIGSLQRFLHPLTGGYENRGWEFGRLPCLSDFYALLEAVAGVDHIENLVMTLQAVMPTGVPLGTPRVVTEEKPLTVEMPGYTLLFSGEHKVTTKALG
ncbi:MAG TPA: putative baseplate assembly protein, partial [Pyrinomonadaceae bacterium]|nr:putative baseplate assembly protein [Pyrinomonadaceae bacterium]